MKKKTIQKNKIKNKDTNENSGFFPKYTTQIINLASQTNHATRPRVVGQLTEEFRKYQEDEKNKGNIVTIKGWKKYHNDKYPTAFNDSYNKIISMLGEYKKAINLIEKKHIKRWLNDLLYKKTFEGLNVEKNLKSFLIEKGASIKDSNNEEESKNIDLYINEKPYQIKPASFKSMAPIIRV